MLGVICAMDIEANGLIERMEGVSRSRALDYEFTSGTIDGKELVVVLCGIGKANAAAVTAILITNFAVTEVINLGVCGGNIGAGSMIVADNVVQYDFDTTAFGDELGQLDGFDSPYIKCSEQITSLIQCDNRGTIASGDRFITDEKFAQFLTERFGAIGFDMESGAVAQICAKAKIKFAVVRVVSDGGDVSEYQKFKVVAANKGINAILNYLNK